MALEKAIDNPEKIDLYLSELTATADEANHFQCQLNLPEGKKILEQTILRWLWKLLYDSDPATLEIDVARIERAITVGEKLHLGLSLDRAQETYYKCFHQRIVPNCFVSTHGENTCRWELRKIKPLLKLGQLLAIDVSGWLD